MYQINFNHPIHIYFIGIGGISMSGLAEILLERGFTVSGSDWSRSPLTDALESKGACIHYGNPQKAENITDDIDLAVYTAAVHTDNPEFQEIMRRHIPSLTRAQLLGQIMKNYETPIAVSGTHGKTTTTSMVSEVLLKADTDPTLSIGGILSTIGSNIRIGRSGYFATEACEYTNSFLSFFPKIGIILNIEEDHMDFFKDIDDIRSSFRRFAQLLPEDGALIINSTIEKMDAVTAHLACPVITYGPDNRSDYWPEEISYDGLGRAAFTLCCKDGSRDRFSLGVAGEHNIYNAMAVIALSDRLGLKRSDAKEGLSAFTGTNRRFEYKGHFKQTALIDDYAHHPTEITATLQAAANYPHKEIWCVFQPHTFTRTKAFMKEFAQALSLADHVVLTEIYPARETDNLGISSVTLQKEIEALGKTCYYFSTFEEIENFLWENCSPDDLLITMGAGNVVNIGENLLKR